MTNHTNKNIPSLFDRLSEDGDYSTHQGISNKKMKEMVIRDLLFLLNTTSYYYTNAEETYEYEKSVLNFGIETISGKKSSDVDWAYIERNIKTAIKLFEPRVLGESLQVKCDLETESDLNSNEVKILISGYIQTNPIPERFVLHANIDIENDNFSMLE
ncbi:type VI secretion system lysozyme-like protein [Acinetobacter sp. Ac_877]|uniref:type VI secretion system baseplate subunit TssE n=1 Tax=Acinetobacter portensis TaxID=1839785 RepID=UPI00128E5156|nr:type VI secretion system baseplate subunit TssE [Acinetobacter portensis]MPW40795.1 type VI secretion system lysozyme-like protein [Acinetobacter portensis]